jgi:hypothetical protein
MIHDIQQLLFFVTHEDYPFGHSLPTAIPGKLLRHPWNLVIVELFSSPILSPRNFTFRLFFSTTKVCPVSLIFLMPAIPLSEYRR